MDTRREHTEQIWKELSISHWSEDLIFKDTAEVHLHAGSETPCRGPVLSTLPRRDGQQETGQSREGKKSVSVALWEHRDLVEHLHVNSHNRRDDRDPYSDLSTLQLVQRLRKTEAWICHWKRDDVFWIERRTRAPTSEKAVQIIDWIWPRFADVTLRRRDMWERERSRRTKGTVTWCRWIGGTCVVEGSRVDWEKWSNIGRRNHFLIHSRVQRWRTSSLSSVIIQRSRIGRLRRVRNSILWGTWTGTVVTNTVTTADCRRMFATEGWDVKLWKLTDSVRIGTNRSVCMFFSSFCLRLKDPAEVYAHARVTDSCMIHVNRMDGHFRNSCRRSRRTMQNSCNKFSNDEKSRENKNLWPDELRISTSRIDSYVCRRFERLLLFLLQYSPLSTICLYRNVFLRGRHVEQSFAQRFDQSNQWHGFCQTVRQHSACVYPVGMILLGLIDVFVVVVTILPNELSQSPHVDRSVCIVNLSRVHWHQERGQTSAVYESDISNRCRRRLFPSSNTELPFHIDKSDAQA